MKKKKEDDKSYLCQKNHVCLKYFYHKDTILEQLQCSKMIFNQALFCQRMWFSRILKIFYSHFLNLNDEELRIFLLDSSPEDKKTLLFHAIHYHPSKINLLIETFDKKTSILIIKHFSKYEKNNNYKLCIDLVENIVL